MPIAISMALFAAAAPAEGSNPYLNQAKTFQQQLDYEKCLRRLEQASRWSSNTPAQLAEIELYSGLCEAGLGHETEAYEHFELGFQLDPSLELPPQQGPKIESLFQKAKAKAPKVVTKPPEPEPKRDEPVAAPPPPAPPAAVAAEPPRERHLAVPLALGGVSLISGGVGLVFGLQAQSTLRDAMAARFDSDDAALRQVAASRAMIANVMFAVAGAALVAAVISWFVLN